MAFGIGQDSLHHVFIEGEPDPLVSSKIFFFPAVVTWVGLGGGEVLSPPMYTHIHPRAMCMVTAQMCQLSGLSLTGSDRSEGGSNAWWRANVLSVSAF